MKKFISFAILLCALNGFAQKTMYIYNFSSYTMTVSYIQTCAALGVLPYLNNNPGGTSSLNITIPAGGSYTLQNLSSTTRFPFLDTSGASPAIANWYRKSTTTGAFSSAITSNNTWLAYGAGQEFNYVKFTTNTSGGNGGNVGNGYNGSQSFFTTGNNLIDADYVINNPSAGFYDYTVVLTDH